MAWVHANHGNRAGSTMRQHFKTTAVVAVVVGLLALASFFTTSIFWVGGFPSGEFRLDVRNPEGLPVKGAVLRIYHGGTRDLAFKYPLDNHLADQELISNEKGRITGIREDGEMQFGGHAWRLFWIIPIGAKSPQFDCEITADGYQTLKFPVSRLFESTHVYYEDSPKAKLNVMGKEIEVPVYAHTFTMAR